MTPRDEVRSGSSHRLSPRRFYSIIVAGVVLGMAGCTAAGWAYLEYGGRQPSGRRVWDGMAAEFVIPVCVMIGSTFGGIAGVAIAMFCDRGRSASRRRSATD